MILSIIKRVIAIYSLSSIFLILSAMAPLAFADTSDIQSFCFERDVNLKEAHQSLNILLLPKDIVDLRNEDNCMDIVTTQKRAELFSKYLGKRYALKKITDQEAADCRLDLRTTRNARSKGHNLKIGEENSINKSEGSSDSVSSMEILLGEGKSGEISVGESNLKILCRLIGNDNANLIFSYAEKNKASLNSEVTIKKNEWLNVASVLKDLNDKNHTLGIPQTEVGKTEEKIETKYEIRFK